MEAIGRTRWALAEGYIPKGSHGPSPQMISHETLCLLNTSNNDADVRITIYFAERESVGPIGSWFRRGARNIFASMS